ncbi:hypothetical protein JCM9279_006284 [Rhodotorula babjevae]
MFTSFSTGEDHPANWNDTPAYLPGRFHAHVRPSSPPIGSSPRAHSVHHLPLSSSPGAGALSSGSPTTTDARQRSRTRPLGRALLALSGTKKRELREREEEEERAALLGAWIGGGGGRGGAGRATQAAALQAALGVPAVEEMAEEDDEDDRGFLRPGRKRVERWMGTWWRRWAVLVGAPCLLIWLWCSVPFPVQDPYDEQPPWHIPWPPPTDPPTSRFESLLVRLPWLRPPDVASSVFEPPPQLHIAEPFVVQLVPRRRQGERGELASPVRGHDQGPARRDKEGAVDPPQPKPVLPVDANFYFFLVCYYGFYLAVGLVFVTKLFDLYRLNWWPSSLGGGASYFVFWALSLTAGFALHHFDLDGFGDRTRSRKKNKGPGEQVWDWERKTIWVLLAFATMAVPALACFAKLRADRRNSYRRSLTPAQKTFLERQLAQRMPRSYRRFLWFLGVQALALVALIIGQGFAAVYLSTLPHNNLEGLFYVWSWVVTVNLLNAVSGWILLRKVRSQALLFTFKFYYFLVYHIFYRNLFARLRSPDQAAYITLLSSSVVVVWYPLSMSRTVWRLLRWSTGLEQDWAEYAASKGEELYLRNLSESVTMIAFLGWLSILHWGPNRAIYPFFAFDNRWDPYTYRLTLTASLVIYAAELVSSWLARIVCWLAYGVDVTNLGLNQFREHPELVVACVFTSCHVLSDMLLFLVKLNFR